MKALYRSWLSDQLTALSAATLAATEVESGLDASDAASLARATSVIDENVVGGDVSNLTESTLALLAKIPSTYRSPDRKVLPGAVPLDAAVNRVLQELEQRRDRRQRPTGILIGHAVYVLRQSHVSMRDWLKWLSRCDEPSIGGLRVLLRALEDDESSIEVDDALARTRDGSALACVRSDAVDRLHDRVMSLMSKGHPALWWTSVCMALRNSLYCWPLMVAGSSDSRLHGISLPIGLSVSQDGKSHVYFRILDPDGASRHRHYVPPREDSWAHMEASSLHWNRDWSGAFHIGLRVAKRLWNTQNGRFRFVDEASAEGVRTSSAVVDLGPACAIVDSLLGGVNCTYRLSGRSAEAYWVQAFLGLMLPAGQLPLGVVTGRVQTVNGLDEIHHVEGTNKKLEYANNVGFSRVVLPEPQEARTDDDDDRFSHGMQVQWDAEPVAIYSQTIPHDDAPADGEGSDRNANQATEEAQADEEVRAFLQSLEASDSRKTIEINFCRDIRTAADAMQASGWRRTTFIRLPEAQHAFSAHLRRLFLGERIEQGFTLADKDLADYRRNPWTERDSRAVQTLDRYLLSETRAIKFVDRRSLDRRFPGAAEAEIGKWLAWKDHQVRRGEAEGGRGPGLGILSLRTANGDHETRLWSALAHALSASSEWWDRFQWSDREQAAELLAQLLANQRANPAICSTPSPDVVVIFDEGNLSQRRTNPIFPDDFRGQWLDLLNPSRDTEHVRHALNEALLDQGAGRVGGTKIIVIYGAPDATPMELPSGMDDEDRDRLERLAVYRFDFSIQDAFAIMNYGREESNRLSWIDVDRTVGRLISQRLVVRTRGRFYIPSPLLPALRTGTHFSSPQAHFAAAKAVTPILEPHSIFIASNRDRTLEPEPVLESTWHLHRARSLSSARDKRGRMRYSGALSSLTFLRAYADWDTVKQLQHTQPGDAVELARELLVKERRVTGRAPHSSRVAALLNVIGDYGRTLSSTGSERMKTLLAEEATGAFAQAVADLEAATASDSRRQKRKLFSEFVYCMKILGIADNDHRLKGPSAYLWATVGEIMQPDFIATLGHEDSRLDDYPLSRDWLRIRWEDAKLHRRDRSTHAYAAARLHLGRWRDGELTREPWDQPWIEYFAITSPQDFVARQLNGGPLATWDAVYGADEQAAIRFGSRVLDFVSYKPKGSAVGLSWWASKMQSAVDNLWAFVNHPEPERRLPFDKSEIALKLIRVIVFDEALPAFDFVQRTSTGWLPEWPRCVGRARSPQWNALAARVITSKAGWITMLSSCGRLDESDVSLAQSWLHAYNAIGAQVLLQDDPEELLRLPVGTIPLVDSYRKSRRTAINNGYALLKKTNQRGVAVYGHLRAHLQSILRQLDDYRSQAGQAGLPVNNGAPRNRGPLVPPELRRTQDDARRGLHR